MSTPADRLLHLQTATGYQVLSTITNALYGMATDSETEVIRNKIAKCLLRIIHHFDTLSVDQGFNVMTYPLMIIDGSKPISLDMVFAATPAGVLDNARPIIGQPYDSRTSISTWDGFLGDETLDLFASKIAPEPRTYIFPATDVSRFIVPPNDNQLGQVDIVANLKNLISQAPINADGDSDNYWEFFPGFDMPEGTTTVMFACNIGLHWIAVVFHMHGSRGFIYVYDSAERHIGTVANGRHLKPYDEFLPLMAELMRLRPNSDWQIIDWLAVPVEVKDCLQQDNASDCGPLALSNMLRHSHDIPEMSGLTARAYFLALAMRDMPELPEWADKEIAAVLNAQELKEQQKKDEELKKKKEEKDKADWLAKIDQDALKLRNGNNTSTAGGIRASDIDRLWNQWIHGRTVPSSEAEFKNFAEFAFKSALRLQPSKVYPHAAPRVPGVLSNRKYVATGDHIGSVATGATLTSGQYNASRPRWTLEHDVIILDLYAKGWTCQRISAEKFANMRTSAAVQSRLNRLYQIQEQDALTASQLADDPTIAPSAAVLRKRAMNANDPQLLAQSHATFNENQARLFLRLKAGWRSYSGSNSHAIFQYADPAVSDISNIAELLEDHRTAVVEARRLIPAVQHAQVMPFHVLVSQAINDFQSGRNGVQGATMHDWQLGEVNLEHVFYFAGPVAWTAEMCAAWRLLTLHGQMRCSDARLEWMWSDPNMKVLSVTALFASKNEIEGETDATRSYTASLTLSQPKWTEARNKTSAGSLLMLCFPDRVVFSTLAALAACTGDEIGGSVTYANGTVSITMRPLSPQFGYWCGGRMLPMKNLSVALLASLHSAYVIAAAGHLGGTALESWRDVSARLYPG